MQLRGLAGRRPLATRTRWSRGPQRTTTTTAELVPLTAQDVQVERAVGSVGYGTMQSWPPRGSATQPGDTGGQRLLEAAERDRSQQMQPGAVQAKLYTGRIMTGEKANARVLLKAYPSRRSGAVQADAMAANEFRTLANLQPPSVEQLSPFVSKLLGGFQATEGLTAGEQWLVFRFDGTTSAADYAAEAAVATREGRCVGNADFFDRLDGNRPLGRRQQYIRALVAQAVQGLNFVHGRNVLHQSLGANSVLVSSTSEQDVASLQVRLQDFAFAVDVSDAALQRGVSMAELLERGPAAAAPRSPTPVESLATDLWRRAASAGVQSVEDQRSFGKADDIYAAGLLLAYMAFAPLCAPGSVDFPTLLKLLEGTFRLDLAAARDYCAADERWARAVAFLDYDEGAGWQLLQSMLAADWRARPAAADVLRHRFFRPKW